MKFRKEFLGLDGFQWWIGVVENRHDPLGLGRCQIRALGVHSEHLYDIPSEDLPWALPMHSVNNQSFSTPKEGDYVFGFYLDGRFAQSPIIMGILPGIPANPPDPTKGFNDIRSLDEIKNSPKKPANLSFNVDGTGATVTERTDYENLRYPRPDEIGVPTNSNLVRNQNIDSTIVQNKKDNIVSVTVNDNNKWEEPPPAYAAEYPFNKVLESESGHLMEFDDTPGAERIHLAHRAGTFSEWYPSGSKVEKIVKNNYQIILSDDHLYVVGRVNMTVGSDANIRVVGNANIQAENDLNIGVAKDVNFTVGGDFKVKASQGIYFESGGEFNAKIGGQSNIEAGSSLNLFAGGSVNIDGSDVKAELGAAGPAISTGLGAPPSIGTPTSAPIFVENSPKITISTIIQNQIDSLVSDYISNPSKYSNALAANGDVKENYPGAPDVPSSGESLIINPGPGAMDLCEFLAEQLRLTQSNGYWSETGMGGAKSNPNILNIWKDLGFGNKGAWSTDQTPWCMGFVNYALKRCGYRFLQSARAFDVRDRATDYKFEKIANFSSAKCGDIALWSYSHVSFVYRNDGGALSFVGGNQSPKGRGNDNNPSKGDLTVSWQNGYVYPGNGSLMAIFRPVKY